MTESLLGLVEKKELLDFSQAFSIDRPDYLGNRLFPNRKAQYFQAEAYRLCENGNLPMVAKVHGWDVEAEVSERIPFEKVETEEILIKRKINQTESLRKLINRGIPSDKVLDYVYDDATNLSDSVVARAELMKMELLSTGKVKIDENDVKLDVDYGVPSGNLGIAKEWDADADILGDIESMVDAAWAKGARITNGVTSRAVLSAIKKNKSVQTAIFGASGVGTLPTTEQVNALLSSQFDGLTLETNEERYAIPTKSGRKLALSQGRFFPADCLALVAAGNGSIGTGLWGVTPEEEAQGGAFDSKREGQYVTVTQWSTPDPVAAWTKATGVFFPILANPYGLVTAKVTLS